MRGLLNLLICLLLLAPPVLAAPVFTPGGGIASSRINPTYQIGQDGIAKFSNVDPRTLLGGQPISTVLSQMGQNSQGLATEIARAQSAESQAVKKADVGSTVAGLDDNLNVSAPIAANGPLTAAPITALGHRALVNAGRFPIVSNASVAADVFQNPDAFQIGGLPVSGWQYSTGATNGQETRPGALIVAGQPWGPYNGGALVSLLNTQNVDPQNGVCSSDWRHVNDQGVWAFCGGDGVMEFVGTGTTLAQVSGQVTAFTTTSATLATPLTAAELARLRVGSYVRTNYVNSGITVSAPWYAPTAKPINQNYYVGVVSGWSSDGGTIYVSGWDIPWGGDHKPGKIPGQQSGDALDTFFSNTSYPTIAIGAAYNASARNEYLDYKGYQSGDDPKGKTTTVGAAQSVVHMLTGDEVDLRYWATRPQEVRVDGITVGVSGDNGTPLGREALTKDSYLMSLSGDIPNLLILDGPADGNIVSAHSFYLHGEEGVQTVNGVNRPVQTLFGFTSQVDGMSAFNLMGWTKKDVPSVTGTSGASFHLGMIYNGYANTLDPSQNGQGEIVWNHNGANVGGVSICGGGGVCPIDVSYLGNLTINSDITTAAGKNYIGGAGSKTYWNQPSGGQSVSVDTADGVTAEWKTSAGGDASLSGYNGTFSGGVTATGALLGKAGVQVGNGASLILYPSTTGGYSYMTGASASEIDLKTSAGGNASLGGIYNLTATGAVTFSALAGTGNAYACVNAGGQIYRSATACN
ncbi:hypothetical protein ACQW08_06440 [Gluconobacter japonicus]|uniref:hypothetical protein n=1 Tax=Gluconobacter japonicus TaxID=376620 RepID=UPI003D29FD43